MLLVASCSKSAGEKDKEASDTRFSVMYYGQEQWETYKGQPYGIIKKVTFNGITDSVITNSIDMDWAPVVKAFFETDISSDKFAGQYDFSAFNDPASKTNTFLFEAKNKKLYTKKLQVIADEETNLVKAIYIEAGKSDRMGTRDLKLFYIPVTSISIQELETSRTGRRKELRVAYDFM
ncbi:MAG: hypothetical protein H6550_10345 [Chitinophagales bacterium]|nr:hypothetical protein [Chitinophagales bacterium]